MAKHCHKSKCIQWFRSVTLRAVRDRFIAIMRKYEPKARKEIAGTGLGGEERTEYEQLLKDHIERYEESERRRKEC